MNRILGDRDLQDSRPAGTPRLPRGPYGLGLGLPVLAYIRKRELGRLCGLKR